MGNFVTNLFLAETDIVPALNKNGFWPIVGNFFVNLGSMILNGVAYLFYWIIKFALNVVDFMQLLVQKLAGVDAWLHLDKLDLNNLQETDVVFRFLLSDTVTTVFRALFSVFLVLLILFSIIAILKNEYGNAANGGNTEHKKTLYTAVRAILAVILVPFILIAGILTSNAILAGLVRAFNVNSSLSLGGQIFVSSAYDASCYRIYAENGNRRPVSNLVTFTDHDGNTYSVSSAISVINPNDYDNDSLGFCGYMFTFDGKDYCLLECLPDSDDAVCSEKYYIYIKYILGAYIVEKEPGRNYYMGESNTSIYEYYKTNYNPSLSNNSEIVDLVKAQKAYFDDNSNLKNYGHRNASSSLWTFLANTATFGIYDLIRGSETMSYNANNGYMAGVVLDHASGVGTPLSKAAYNTWTYNMNLTDAVSGWREDSNTLQFETATFTTKAGSTRNASRVKNSYNWGRLHDGGVENSFAPLAVEYNVMADVLDFVIANDVKLYYVNANNTWINYDLGSGDDKIDANTLYIKQNESGTNYVAGYLVDYKNEGRIAYDIVNAKSEVEGATFIICYFDSMSQTYIPLTNNVKMYDDKGNSFEFHSGSLASDYKGVIIARAMFDENSRAADCVPTYIAQTSVIDSDLNSGIDFSQVAMNNTGKKYNFLQQLTNVDGNDIKFANVGISGGDIVVDTNSVVYYSSTNSTLEDIAPSVANKILEKLGDDYAVYGSPYAFVDNSFKIDFLNVNSGIQNYVIELELTETNQVEVAGTLNTPVALYEYKFNVRDASVYGDSAGFTLDTNGVKNSYNFGGTDFTAGTVLSSETTGTLFFDVDQDSQADADLFGSTNTFFSENQTYQTVLLDIINRTSLDSATYSVGSTLISGGKVTLKVYNQSVGHYTTGAVCYTIVANTSFDERHDPSSFPGTVSYGLNFTVTKSNVVDFAVPTASDIYDDMNEGSIVINNGYIYYLSTDAKFDVTSAAYQTTRDFVDQLIVAYNNAQEDISEITVQTISIGRAAITDYVADVKLKISLDDGKYYFTTFTLDLERETNRTATGRNNAAGDELLLRKVKIKDVVGENTFKAYVGDIPTSAAELESAHALSNYYDEADHELILSISDFESDIVTRTDKYYVELGDGSKVTIADMKEIVYKYTADDGTKYSYAFNAILSHDPNTDGGYKFIAFNANAELPDLWTEFAETENASSILHEISLVRVIKTSNYAYYTHDETNTKSTYYFILQNFQLDDTTAILLCSIEIDDAKTTISEDDIEAIKIQIMKLQDNEYVFDSEFNVTSSTSDAVIIGGVDTHIPKSLLFEAARTLILSRIQITEYEISTIDFSDNEQSGAGSTANIYKTTVTSTTGNNFIVYASNIDVAENFAQIEEYFLKYLSSITIDGKSFGQVYKSGTDDVEKMFNLIAHSSAKVNFCVDKIDHHLLKSDIKIDLGFLTGDNISEWRFRLHFGATYFQENENVNSSGNIIHNSVLVLNSGAFELDYSFSNSQITVSNIYKIAKLNWIFLIFATVIVFGVLGKAVWGLIRRIYQITLLFLISPAVASTLPLGDDRFKKWREELISEVLGAYGVCIGLNFFFIILPVIKSASAIFTDADVQGLSSSLRWFVKSADRLNSLVYLLFLLVAVTLLKSVPSFVADLVGGKDAVKEGEAIKQDVTKGVAEAGNVVSGRSAMKAVDNFKNQAADFIPGSAIAKDIRKKYKDKQKGKQDAREKENKALQNEDVQSTAQSILDRYNGKEKNADEKENDANENQESIVQKEVNTEQENSSNINQETPPAEDKNGQTQEETGGEDVGAENNEANPNNETKVEEKIPSSTEEKSREDKGEEGGTENNEANPSSEVTEGDAKEESAEVEKAKEAEKAKEVEQEEKDEKQNQAQENLEARIAGLEHSIVDLAQAQQKASDLAAGKVHDYVGDREQAFKEQQQAERDAARAQRQYEKSAEGRAEKAQQKLEIARETGKMAVLTEAKIKRYNEQHKNDPAFVALLSNKALKDLKEKIKKGEATDEEKQRYDAQKVLHKEARMAIKQDILNNVVEDEKLGIKHGVGASIKRQLVGGQKTGWQRIQEQEKLDKALTDAQASGNEEAIKRAQKAIDNYDTKKGLLHQSSKPFVFAGRVVANKAMNAPQFVRENGLNFVLGASKKQKAAAEATIAQYGEKYSKLQNDVNQKQKIVDQTKAELDKLNKSKDKQVADIIKKLDEYNKKSTYTQKEAENRNELYREAVKAGLFKGTAFEELVYARDKNGKTKTRNTNDFMRQLSKQRTQLENRLQSQRDNLKASKIEMSKFEKETGIKRAFEITNGTNIRSIGAVGEVARFGKFTGKKAAEFGKGLYQEGKNYLNMAAVQIANSKVGRAAKTAGKTVGEATVTAGKAVGKAGTAAGRAGAAVGKFVSAPVRKFHKWNEQRKDYTDQAYGRFKGTRDKELDKSRQRRKTASEASSEQLLATNEKRADAILAKLEQKANKMRKNANKQDLLDLVAKQRGGDSLTADEQKRFKTYVRRYATARNIARQNTARTMKSQENAVKAAAERKYATSLDNIRKDMKNSENAINKRIDREVDRRMRDIARGSRGPRNSPSTTLSKVIKDEVQKELKKQMANAGNGKMTAEIKSLQDVLARLNSSNASYKRSIKSLQVSNRKLSKQVKNNKSKSALEQATKTGGSFGVNASGK